MISTKFSTQFSTITRNGLLVLLAVTCDQHRSAVGPVLHIVLRPSKRMATFSLVPRPSIRPFVLRGYLRYEQITNTPCPEKNGPLNMSK